jgi:uncharacterized protein YbjT (DUF2867 family)
LCTRISDWSNDLPIVAVLGLGMRIFVAGATGAVRRELVPALIAKGHAVTGLTRSAAKAEAIRSRARKRLLPMVSMRQR